MTLSRHATDAHGQRDGLRERVLPFGDEHANGDPYVAPLVRMDGQSAIERAAAAIAHANALMRVGTDNGKLPRPRSLPERLARSEARFRALVSVTGHVMWGTDEEGRIIEGQHAWKAFTGQSTQQLYAQGGLGWVDALHPDDRDETLTRFRNAIAGEHYFEHQVRLQQRRDDGLQWRDTFMRAAPVTDIAGSVVEWVIVNSDVTEFTFAQAEAEAAERAARRDAERARDLAEAAWHEAEAATAAKARVLAASSHDLRTPLAAITGYASLLAQGLLGPVTDEQRGALTRIGVAGEHLLALVTDILDAAVVESGSMRFTIKGLPLGDVCERLATLTAHSAEFKGVEFSCRVQPRTAEGVLVMADRERLLQVLVNLVTNAVKFTSAGGTVSVELSVSGDRVLMAVRDTGCGIAPGDHARIFEPFVKLARPADKNAMRKRGRLRGQTGNSASDSERDSKGIVQGDRGVGLGLATSRELARSMGGDITVSSELGAGATFTLTLPAAT